MALPPIPGKLRTARRAFTLMEVLVATGVLVLLLGILLAITNSVTQTVRWSVAKVDAFAAARSAFDLMNHRLSAATLNTYWDYDNPLAPTVYLRQSDLHFLTVQNTQNSGYGQEIYFEWPESLSSDATVQSTQGLLNACGFFVQYGRNNSFRPATVTADRWRYRLMQGIEPTEKLGVFGTKTSSWNTNVNNGGTAVRAYATPVADNVIALVVWPRLAGNEDPTGTKLTADYQYDSRKDVTKNPQPITANQLPPSVQVTLITVSEASAVRLDSNSATPPAVIEDALRDKFKAVADYEKDLKAITDSLATAHLEFQVFTNSVVLRESKWSDATP